MADSPAVERCRPLLGTRVAIRVQGLAATDAHRAIDAAFREVDTAHRLMSFHEPASELSRLNRAAAIAPQAVSPQTRRVLAWALRIAHASGGHFDPCIAPRLVEAGALPPPAAPAPDPRATFRDIVLTADGRVFFRTPLWLDLGGIAKGFAVDRAIACLSAYGALEARVNAGGDLRLYGQLPQPVLLRPFPGSPCRAVLQLHRGAVTVSHTAGDAHFDGVTRNALPEGSGVAIAAPRAVIADALTKVALVDPWVCAPLLNRWHASACYCSDDEPWHDLKIAS